ncbi:HD domain-containing protein [Mariprofundus erugo]|uniref:HD domain-containing protein n=1 Tax=Mariprofundus erugo TaxID=2528639 RepID=A0A5R9GP94_9PROT|nr:HD domain-containing phosphohydrolase [Mariprofundus erugo]TLS66243.1 HD domain-containing protein [Mariprofundus erugo]TLS78337.1 HD domain-containing protein [Mariprofundus erugo]
MDRFAGNPDENETLSALIGALHARDAYNRDHASRTNQVLFVTKLLKRFKIEPEVQQQIRNATLIHDIGMISVPDHILLKPGRLSLDERTVVEQAPLVAANILEHVKSLSAEREMILHQSEWWDGNGYPNGLKGRDIPIGSRFIAVAKAIDAMTRDRAYRRARPLSYCLQELRNNGGKQFDPTIAEAAATLLCAREGRMG